MGQKLALVIATADYQDAALARLRAPGLDAYDFAGALQAPDIGAFDSVQVLLNETEPAARRAIARFFAGRRPDDLLLLYFSGHGVRDEQGQLYLAVSDTDRSLLSATGIPASFVNAQMNASRSRRQVLILDCCNSGAFAHGSKGGLGGSMGIATAFEGTGYGRVVLTATDATQYAWEGDEARGEASNSVFTHYLVKGLETGAADADGDGRITLDELYEYVYEQVVVQTPRQTPGKFTYNQQGELVIANNPRPVARPAQLPPELRQAVESPLMAVREAAVRELEALLRGSHRGQALAALEALERLTDDDSRRVSAAAAASLAAHAEAQRLAQAEGERRAAEQAMTARALLEAQQRAAEERAAAEKAAEEKAQQERQAKARLAAEQAERERLAREQAETERRAELERLAQARVLAEKQAAERAAAEKAAAEMAEQEGLARLKAAEEAAVRKQLADRAAEQAEPQRLEAAQRFVNEQAEQAEQRAAGKARREQVAETAERPRVIKQPAAPRAPEGAKLGTAAAVNSMPPTEAKPVARTVDEQPTAAQRDEAPWRLARPTAEPGFGAILAALVTLIETNYLPSARGALTRAWRSLPAWPTAAPWVLTAVVAVAWGYASLLGDAIYYWVTESLDLSFENEVAGAVGSLVVFGLGGLAVVGLLALLRRELRGRSWWVVWGRWCVAAAVGLGLVNLTKALDWSIGQLATALLMSGLPGLALAWGLLGAPRADNRLSMALIMLGWVVAHLISAYMSDKLSWSTFWLGVPFGAVGAGVTFWQLRDWLDVRKPLPVTAVRASTPKPTVPPAMAASSAAVTARPSASAPERGGQGLEITAAAWAFLAPVVSTVLIAVGWWFVVPFGWEAYERIHKIGLREDLVETIARGGQWAVQYGLSAVVVVLALALARRSFRRGRALLLPLAWVVASALGWASGWGLSQIADWHNSFLTGYLVTGALGGLAVAGLAMYGPRPQALRRTLLIAAGWAAAVGTTFLLHDMFSMVDDTRLLALAGGALGAVVTFAAMGGSSKGNEKPVSGRARPGD